LLKKGGALLPIRGRTEKGSFLTTPLEKKVQASGAGSPLTTDRGAKLEHQSRVGRRSGLRGENRCFWFLTEKETPASSGEDHRIQEKKAAWEIKGGKKTVVKELVQNCCRRGERQLQAQIDTLRKVSRKYRTWVAIKGPGTQKPLKKDRTNGELVNSQRGQSNRTGLHQDGVSDLPLARRSRRR